MGTLTLDAIRRAHHRIAPAVHRTPVVTSAYFDRWLDARLFFKCENFQKVGAFKIRGATNAVLCLPPEQQDCGVVTHSSGNHGQALALAARSCGIPAVVVMPETAPAVKRAAVRGYGAHVRLCAPTMADRERTAAAVIEETGAVLIHPFDDPRIIAGQATAAVELLEEVPDLDLLLAPVGGGGLLSGTALAAHYLAPRVAVFGAEPAAADDACRSLQAGRLLPAGTPETLADGLRGGLSELTFGILQRFAAGIVTASEAAIVEAMRRVWERMKIIVEPSAAVPLAALLEGSLEVAGRRVGIVLSGGNVDLERLPWLAPPVRPRAVQKSGEEP